jgi:hypothetical protein
VSTATEPNPVASGPSGSTPEPVASGARPGGRAARLRRWRGPIAAAGAVLAAALAGLALLGPTQAEPLDPHDAGPQGARAIASVLADHGVDVRLRDRFADVGRDLSGGVRSTVVVARPQRLAPGRAGDLGRAVQAAGADLVLVGAGEDVLDRLGLPVRVDVGVPAQVGEPSCADATAVRAGAALTGGLTYEALDEGPSGASVGRSLAASAACYPRSGVATHLVLHHRDGRTTTLLGGGQPLTNDRLADAGDAALAVGVLGARPRLVWWTPSVTDASATAAPVSPLDLVPDGVRFAVVQLAVVLAVVALWRGRRLGRLVPEPLPVVVRAVETTRGRARLYRRARARGRAARVLRAAAVRRLALRCGLPRTAGPGEVAAVVAARTGRPAAEVHALLAGAEPADDPSLVRLARDVDALETEVRSR